jgi:hypothetical protein
MVRYYLRHGAPKYFLVSQAKAGLSVAALAELVRMQWPTALCAGQNADTLETVAAARCMVVGCIRAESWDIEKSYCLLTYSG